MYQIHQEEWTTENIEQQVQLYKSIEGDKALKGLKKELKQIIANKDLDMFLDKSMRGITVSDLEFIATKIVTSE